MTGLAKIESGQQLQRDDGGMSQAQIDIIKNTIAKGASNIEFDVFIQTCKRLRLDPFARQIFLVKRWDSSVGDRGGFVATPQVSIDGLRLVAERTGQYRGQTSPEWCGEDGKWTDVWLSSKPPSAARVGVLREGFAAPLVRVARWASYVQTRKDGAPNSMWSKMGDVMLSKCAEALALRAAFPNELSGVYSVEEMGQSENAAPARATRPALPPKTLDQIAAEGTQRAPSQPPPAIEDAEYSADTGETPYSALLSEYAACTTREHFAQLEDARKALWSTLSASEKSALKNASTEAQQVIADAAGA